VVDGVVEVMRISVRLCVSPACVMRPAERWRCVVAGLRRNASGSTREHSRARYRARVTPRTVPELLALRVRADPLADDAIAALVAHGTRAAAGAARTRDADGARVANAAHSAAEPRAPHGHGARGADALTAVEDGART